MSAKMRDLMALTFFLDTKRTPDLSAGGDVERFRSIMELPTPKQKGVSPDASITKLRE